MKMTINFAVLALLCVTANAQSKANHSADQRMFNLGAGDHLVKHRVALSDKELAVLAKDDLMRSELDQNPPIRKLTRQGLEAAEVQLCGTEERDLLIVGSGQPFIGANVGPFWIIRDLPEGPQVAFGAIALSLTIRSAESNKCRDVVTETYTVARVSTTRWHFEGKRYRVVEHASERGDK